MRRPVAGIAACVGLLAFGGACSDDDSSDPTTGPTDPTIATIIDTTDTTATSDAVGVTDPTDSPATTAPTTTTTTTSTTTTIAPPTVEEQIAADYQFIYDGYWACLRAPLNCDTSWEITGTASESAMQATMQALADRGRYVGDEDPGYFVIEDIAVAPDGTTAEVVSCWWSTAVLYGPPVDTTQPVGPDNPPTIVNNTPDSGRQRDRLRLVDGRWRVEGSDLFGESSETNLCPPES